ncbi:hypothetical protein D3C77_453430 [compost metagenome]
MLDIFELRPKQRLVQRKCLPDFLTAQVQTTSGITQVLGITHRAGKAETGALNLRKQRRSDAHRGLRVTVEPFKSLGNTAHRHGIVGITARTNITHVIEEHTLQRHQRITRPEAAHDLAKVERQEYSIMQNNEVVIARLLGQAVLLLADLYWRRSDVLADDTYLVKVTEVCAWRPAQEDFLIRNIQFQNALHHGIEYRGVLWTNRQAEGPTV